jgi:glycopeptide antibiotics resistance protein
MEPEKPSTFTIALFVAYALLLVGIILFKLPFFLNGIENIRSINLVPFAGSFSESGAFVSHEVIENIAVFVPLGIYLSMLASKWSFSQKLIAILSTTLAFEIIQFIFAIGRSDLTDIFANTLGGVIGIGLYALLKKLLKARTDKVINIVALILTIGAVLLLAILTYRIATMMPMIS